MPAKDFMHEIRLIELSDEDLKELLGHTFNAIKDVAEEKMHDPELIKLRDAVYNYNQEHYAHRESGLKARLRAGRSLAKARGIEWRLPSEDS